MNRLAAVSIALSLALSACGDDDGDDAIQPTFSSIQARVFPSCATAVCHDDGGDAPFSMKGDQAYVNLVDVKVTGTTWPAQYAGFDRVEPNDPAKSALMLSLEHHADLPAELKMPPAGPLPAEQIDAVREWIKQGAKKN